MILASTTQVSLKTISEFVRKLAGDVAKYFLREWYRLYKPAVSRYLSALLGGVAILFSGRQIIEGRD